jgi:flagellar protein FliO/FliZ
MKRLLLMLLAVLPACAAESGPALTALNGSGPSLTVSFIRMLGALGFVVALFFGAAWLFKNGFRFQNAAPAQRRLQVLESRSLGARQAVFVVGYENQRMLIGSTPNGLTLLSHLPERGPAEAPAAGERIVSVSFGEALLQALGRK